MFKDCKKYEDWGLLLVRVVAGIIFVLAGWGKVFGGMASGLETAMAGTWLALPALAWSIIGLVELVGGLLLLAGLFVPWASIALAIIMAVSTIVLWTGTMGGGGFGSARLDLMLFSTMILLSMTGAGKIGIDRLFGNSKKSKK